MEEQRQPDVAPVGPVEGALVRWWIVHHDESRMFMVLYLGLAVVLSIAVGLFWLVAVVAVHLGLECLKQRDLYRGGRSWLGAATWELKLDLTLILFSFVISLYMDKVLGAAGIGAAARAGAQGGARFAIWQKVIRGVLLSIDDVAQVGRAVMKRKSPAGQGDDGEGYAQTSWGGPWGKGDWITLGFGVVCLALILVSPWLARDGLWDAIWTLAADLHPLGG